MRKGWPDKYKILFIEYVKFAQMHSVHVLEIPWDVDRDQKNTIHCEDEYINKAKDGLRLEMHTSSRKGLDGRKAGVSIGSLMCENKSCLKLLTEIIINMNEFTKEVMLISLHLTVTWLLMHIVASSSW